MHELPVTQHILEIAQEQAGNAGSSKITKITVSIGGLSGVEGGCVKFYFDELKKGTIAKDAEFDFITIPARLKCRDCATEFTMDESGIPWSCQSCQGTSIAIIDGRDCYVESIEVES